MLYNDFEDMKLPALGFGAMRLPVIKGDSGGDSAVDQEQVQKMVDYAMEHGVNYFDTGWDYHGGKSEGSIGEALRGYPRESYLYADKYPGYDLSKFGKTEETFNAQLERSGLDHFDFYMLHNVCEMNIDQYLGIGGYDTVETLLGYKDQGLIKHFGISSHGNLDTLGRILAKYGDVIEFCQIQLNWLDWDFQDAKLKVELLREHKIPVFVMEPLRGGTLVDLKPEHEAKLREARPSETNVQWGFRFLQGIDGIAMVLSGMSSFEQIEQNIATFEESEPLDQHELELLSQIAEEKIAEGGVPCTACRYCTGHCPMSLDIPGLIALWNEHVYTGKADFITPMAITGMPIDKRPAACVACRSCETFCPQKIAISDVLHKFAVEVKPWGE